MPVIILSVLLQVGLVLHIVKTGRNTTWIWIVVMLPLAGSIAYVIIEIVPGIVGSRTGRNVHKNIKNVLNPNRDINTATQDYSISDIVENSIKLGDECMNKEMYSEAKELYAKSLRGIHKNSPDIMFGLARAEFGLTNYKKVKNILDELILENPDYKNADAHLMYARMAEALNDIDLALQEYEVLDGYYAGPEASYRYALLLKKNSKHDKAKLTLEKIISKSKLSGKHYNSIHKKWISLVKNEYKNSLLSR